MAVDKNRRRDDLYEVSLRDHDERVELSGWVYYVRAVKDEKDLLPRGPGFTGETLVDAPRLALRGFQQFRSRRQGWTVAVVRLAASSTWNDGRPKVVHREKLRKGEETAERISHLVAQAKDGEFAPSE